ncbi:MAG: hypothetical protein LBN07_01440 [Christensenellaceae bacterium]|nr:hypothetical protein [Christensenellaceae bacterium]
MDIFINILVILGIVIVGSAIIVIITDLFLTLLDGNTKGILFRSKTTVVNRETTVYNERPSMINEPVRENISYDQNRVSNNTYVTERTTVIERERPAVASSSAYSENSTIDFDKAAEEERIVKATMQETDERSDRIKLIEARRKEAEERERLAEKEAKEAEERARAAEEKAKVVAEKKDEEEVDRILGEIFDDEEETEEEVVQEAAEDDKDEDDGRKMVAVDEQYLKENEELVERISELEKRITSEKEVISNLERKIEESSTETKTNTHTTTTIVVPGMATGSSEEIENRLEILRARLKQAERELKINKKEYIPLRRVSSTLENDSKKLRRKEAVVAKQKVILYGVNNYVDIDEEKAKKLAEDLDLLEGLRLSVQHCEEVMAKNKDRYPVLERTNKILVNLVAELKSDIALLEAQLERIAKTNED